MKKKMLFPNDRNQKIDPVQIGEDSLLQLCASRDKAIHAAREAVRDTTRLTRLLSVLNDPGPLNLVLDRGLSTLSELFLADIVVLLDPVGTGSFSPLAAIGLPEDIIHLPFSDEAGGFTKLLMDSGGPVLIENACRDQAIDIQLRDLGVETVIGLPVNGNHTVRGVLIVARCRPEPFNEADAALLKTMAYRIGRMLIEKQRNFQMEKIVQSSHEINRHLNCDAIATEAVKRFSIIIGADGAALIMIDSSGAFSCAAQEGLCASSAVGITDLAKSLLSASLLDRGKPFCTHDMTATLTQLSLNSLNVLPVQAFLAIPIQRQDHIQGILLGLRFSAIAYNFGTSQIARLYAEQISAALENSNLYQAVHNELKERKRLEEEQRKWEKQQHQLQKINSLQCMAGAIAHHFNNQLGVVIGNLEMAMDDLAEGQAPMGQLAAAMQGARTAADISGMMLTYLGQTTGKYAELDLTETCRQHLPLLQAAAPKGKILKSKLPSTVLIVRANTSLIQQILTSLTTNAWEGSTEESKEISLTIKRVSLKDIPTTHRFPIDWKPKDKDLACLEVVDTGCGIAEEDIDKIFDPFFSTKFTGRGLGLPVVLGIAKAHGGAVSVESKQGQGSIFRILLPLSGETALRQPKKEIPLATKGDNGTILVVEDQEIVRNMAVTMLIRLGFKALAAKDGVEAVELFRNNMSEIRAVLCDLSMPRMNGWETLSALRRIRPNIPFIMASGYNEDHAISGNHTDAPQAFLQKPYQKIQLKDALSKVLSELS